jgi:phosphoglycolate phosphatase (TIGR01487 family)
LPKKYLQKIDSFSIRSNYYSVLKTKFVKKRTFAVDIDGTITENGGGRIHLDALEALRRLNNMGHDVIYVTGRSSVEAFLLSVFGGTTKIAVGENGGCITLESDDHILLGNIEECRNAFEIIKDNIDDVKEKRVFPRMTEVVLERTFDLELAQKLLSEKNIKVELSDSQYAYHINSTGIDKGTGFRKIMEKLSISRDDVIAIGDSATDIPLFKVAKTSIALGNASDHVKSEATMVVSAKAGDGVLEALDKLAPTLSEI